MLHSLHSHFIDSQQPSQQPSKINVVSLQTANQTNRWRLQSQRRELDKDSKRIWRENQARDWSSWEIRTVYQWTSRKCGWGSLQKLYGPEGCTVLFGSNGIYISCNNYVIPLRWIHSLLGLMCEDGDGSHTYTCSLSWSPFHSESSILQRSFGKKWFLEESWYGHFDWVETETLTPHRAPPALS